jgi:hypothetical protein
MYRKEDGKGDHKLPGWGGGGGGLEMKKIGENR